MKLRDMKEVKKLLNDKRGMTMDGVAYEMLEMSPTIDTDKLAREMFEHWQEYRTEEQKMKWEHVGGIFEKASKHLAKTVDKWLTLKEEK